MQPKRKSQCKQDYDYSHPSYYAVTICTQNRSCIFGVIDNGDTLFNDAGRMIAQTWNDIPNHYPGIDFDVMQIMPKHSHGIIVVREVGTDLYVCPNPQIENRRKTQVGLRIASTLGRKGLIIPGNGRAQGSSPTTLSGVIKQKLLFAGTAKICVHL
jgi:hypothetical protein